MRCIKNIFYAALGWLIMPLVAGAAVFLVSSVIFPALCEWFPDSFVNYSPVSEPYEHAVQSGVLSVIAATLAIAAYSYLLVRFDNERMEYMIEKTEGMYSLGEGFAIYCPRYLAVDFVVAAVIPIPLAVASAVVPEHIVDFIDPVLDYLFSFGRMYTDYIGIVPGVSVMIFVIFITRILAGLQSLRAWQGIWLSETN